MAVPRDGLDTKPGEGSKGGIREGLTLREGSPFKASTMRYSSATSASTRKGLPEPCSILSGAAKITAPVGGN